jgi:hypothetical protein
MSSIGKVMHLAPQKIKGVHGDTPTTFLGEVMKGRIISTKSN